jgi:uncharacterized protein
MVHNFNIANGYFLFDSESGSLLNVDRLAYDVFLSDKKSGRDFLRDKNAVENAAPEYSAGKAKDSATGNEVKNDAEKNAGKGVLPKHNEAGDAKAASPKYNTEADGAKHSAAATEAKDGAAGNGATHSANADVDVGDAALSKYSAEEIAEARAELNELQKRGALGGREIKLPQPLNRGGIKALCLHICHDCNLSCGYCFASQGTFGGGRVHMSEQVGKRAVDFLIKNSGDKKNLEIDFFGGEPLMNFSTVKEIVRYARVAAKKADKHFKFTITTNALLLSDDVIKYLDKQMDNVVISIDGRKAVHDKNRKTLGGGDSFDTVLQNSLNFLRVREKSKKDYYIRGTFTADNLDFSRDVLFLRGLGFKQLSLEPAVLPSSHPQAIRAEHLSAIFAEYETLARTYLEYRKNDGTWFNFFHFMIDLNGGPCIYKRLRGCGAGAEYLAVAPEGEIYPCHQFADNKKYLLGNVNDRGLAKGTGAASKGGGSGAASGVKGGGAVLNQKGAASGAASIKNASAAASSVKCAAGAATSTKKSAANASASGGLNEKIVKLFSDRSVYTKKECKDCFAKYHCSGGCAANSVNNAGGINNCDEIACALMKKRLECALYVYSEEFGGV